MVAVKVNGHKIEDVELFVFDKDGTLIDLYTYWYNMIDMRAEKICSFYGLDSSLHKENLMNDMGIDTANKRLKPNGPVGILPRAIVQKAAEDYLSKLGCEKVSDVCFKVFEEVDALSLKRLNEIINPISGAIELLRKIKKADGKIAIATTDRTNRAKLAVDVLSINDLVDIVVGADMVAESKPSPDMLIFIENKLGIRPEHSVMVGDAKTDVQMGINAKFKASIGVCSGLTDEDTLTELTPFVVEDISQISLDSSAISQSDKRSC